jgi:hypothetical protein
MEVPDRTVFRGPERPQSPWTEGKPGYQVKPVEVSRGPSSQACVSNGSNLLEWFQVRVGTGTKLLQRVVKHEKPGNLHLDRFTPENPAMNVRHSCWN